MNGPPYPLSSSQHSAVIKRGNNQRKNKEETNRKKSKKADWLSDDFDCVCQYSDCFEILKQYPNNQRISCFVDKNTGKGELLGLYDMQIKEMKSGDILKIRHLK